MPIRYDEGDLASPQELPNGFLKCDGRITRTGVFTYVDDQGRERRELRLADEVFRPDALDSFGLAPLTNEHPSEMLTASNTRKFQVGTVGNVRKDENFVRADILITDVDAIAAAQAGKRELSCGYICEVEEKAGITEDGQRFDAIQRNIRGNHVAIVARGRAGNGAALRLDSGDAVMVSSNERRDDPPKGNPMPKIQLGGVEFEAPEVTAQAFRAHLDERSRTFDAEKTRADGLVSELEKLKAERDVLQEKLDAAEKAAQDAVSPERIRDLVGSRVSLERQAFKALGADAKFDAMTDREIKRAVILKSAPGIEEKLDAATDEYVNARFDHVVEAQDAEPAPRHDTGASKPAPAAVDSSARTDALSARQRMVARNRDYGRKSVNEASA